MIGCSRTRVHKQPIIGLYFESETVLKLYNLEACTKKIFVQKQSIFFEVCEFKTLQLKSSVITMSEMPVSTAK